MGNSQNSAQNSSQKEGQVEDDLMHEYKRLGGVMVRVEKVDTSLNTNNSNSQSQSNGKTNPHKNFQDPVNGDEGAPKKPLQRSQINNNYQEQSEIIETAPLYTENMQFGKHKQIRVYVDKEIEFTVEIGNDQLTCGWLLSEVTRRYTEGLTKLRKEREMQAMKNGGHHNSSSGVQNKQMRKFIVALKTTDQRESLDYWLTQYERPLEVIEEGEFLIAHFASTYNLILFTFYITEITNKKSTQEVCKKDFEQIKVIGRGGFSRVILVRKKDTGRLYAMKIMKKNKIIREKKLKPILSERKNEELFFVMDLCTGGEIFFHLNKHQQLNEKQAKFYFIEILLGLEYLHNKNVVYRDIKPENILVDIDGHIRIADFGLSKVIQKRQKSYSFCGSPEYMSPEMLQGAGHDRRVDIYCLGALLFEMLTGLPPFYSKDTNRMYEMILNKELDYPEYLNPQIVNLVSSLIQKDPNQRIQSISEIKKHPWLQDVNWVDVLNKQLIPPIIPSVKECYIDPDYIELPLDFEESQYKVRLSTERRYSYYYESTLQSKSVTEQSFYNHFFENKNESGSGIVNLLGNGSSSNNKNGSSIRSGLFQSSTNNPYGLSVQSEQSIQSQDSNNQQAINKQIAQNKNIINGLENFTFIDVPPEEVEIQKQLKRYRKGSGGKSGGDRTNDKNSNDQVTPTKDTSVKKRKVNSSQDSPPTFQLNVNQISLDKPAIICNQKQMHRTIDNNHSSNNDVNQLGNGLKRILGLSEERKQMTTQQPPQIGFNYYQSQSKGDKNYDSSSNNQKVNFTLSNKSQLTCESNQSIAQEYRQNESISALQCLKVPSINAPPQPLRQSQILQGSLPKLPVTQEVDDEYIDSLYVGTLPSGIAILDSLERKDANKHSTDNFSFKNQKPSIESELDLDVPQSVLKSHHNMENLHKKLTDSASKGKHGNTLATPTIGSLTTHQTSQNVIAYNHKHQIPLSNQQSNNLPHQNSSSSNLTLGGAGVQLTVVSQYSQYQQVNLIQNDNYVSDFQISNNVQNPGNLYLTIEDQEATLIQTFQKNSPANAQPNYPFISNPNQITQSPQFGRSGSQINYSIQNLNSPPLLIQMAQSQKIQIPNIAPNLFYQNSNQLQNIPIHTADLSMLEKFSEDNEAKITNRAANIVGHKSPSKKISYKSQERNISGGMKKSQKPVIQTQQPTKTKKSKPQNLKVDEISERPHDSTPSATINDDQSFTNRSKFSEQKPVLSKAASGRQSSNQVSKMTSQGQNIEYPYQGVKKGMHQHKPSYSLSPTNMGIEGGSRSGVRRDTAASTNVNAFVSTSKAPIKSSAASIKNDVNSNKPLVKKSQIQQQAINNNNTNNNKNGSIGMKSFLKAALPLSQQHNIQMQLQQQQQFSTISEQSQYKTPDGVQSNSQQESDILIYSNQQSSKKSSQNSLSRAQKFRSMDMTQNLLKKSMGQKGAVLKNSVAWKQHLLQIQTSSAQQIQGKEALQKISSAKDTPFSNGDMKQNISPQNANEGSIMTQQNNNVTNFDQKSEGNKSQIKLNQNRTPERRESDISMETKSNATSKTTKQANGFSSTNTNSQTQKRRSNESTSTANRLNNNSNHQNQQSQNQQQTGNISSHMKKSQQIGVTTGASNGIGPGVKVSMFKTPKNQKMSSSGGGLPNFQMSSMSSTQTNGTAVSNSTQCLGYNSQRQPMAKIISGSQMQMKSSTQTIKSRNEANTKKSNTAQGALTKKFKNL